MRLCNLSTWHISYGSLRGCILLLLANTMRSGSGRSQPILYQPSRHSLPVTQCARTSGDASRSRETWRLGTALIQAGRLDEAKALFTVQLLRKPDEAPPYLCPACCARGGSTPLCWCPTHSSALCCKR